MKRFVSKVQNLSQRAAQIRGMIERVPEKVASIQDVVTKTTGHIQRVRADLHSTVSTLRAETDAQFVETLREIDASTELLAAAGMRLRGVDLDLGPTRRLIVQLERAEDVSGRVLGQLIGANSHHAVRKALLSAIVQARELAREVAVEHIAYRRLTVEIGLIPMVRIGWRTADEEPETPRVVPAAAAPVPVPAEPPVLGSAAAFAVVPPTVVAPMTTPAVVVASAPAPAMVVAEAPARHAIPEPAAPSATPPRWGSGALDRFKKMPDLGR